MPVCSCRSRARCRRGKVPAMSSMRIAVAIVAAVAATLSRHAVPSGALAEAPFELPAPTGKYPVGTTTWRLTDPARKETLDPSGAPRSVEVLAWYPAAAPASGARAPYLREGLAEVQTFARMVGAPEREW